MRLYQEEREEREKRREGEKRREREKEREREMILLLKRISKKFQEFCEPLYQS